MRLVADHLAIRSDNLAGPPFGQAQPGLQMRDCLALYNQSSGNCSPGSISDPPLTYHFFARSSRIADMSSIVSASNRFS